MIFRHGLAAEGSVLHGNRNDRRAARFDIRTCGLKRLQLEIAIRAPCAAIEADHKRAPCEQLTQAHTRAVLIPQLESWRRISCLERHLGLSAGILLLDARHAWRGTLLWFP